MGRFVARAPVAMRLPSPRRLLASAALWAFEFVFLARWRSSLLPSTCCATDFVSQQLFHVPSFSDIIRPKLGIPDTSSPQHLALESHFVAHLTYEHPRAQENRNCSAACFEPLKFLSPKFSPGHHSGMDRFFCTGARLSWSHPASVTSIGKGTK